jgi:predicted metal-dependent phosphotriesterase family hydrolase
VSSALSGKALTVLGAIDAEAMGVTLPHEHLLIDFAVMFKEPAAASEKGLAYQPVSLANVGWVRQNFNANLDNLRLLDEQTALDEIMLFRRAGGQTVVDPTNVSLARDPLALARISRATGLNIVMGAGYYVAAAHPADGPAERGLHRPRDRPGAHGRRGRHKELSWRTLGEAAEGRSGRRLNRPRGGRGDPQIHEGGHDR